MGFVKGNFKAFLFIGFLFILNCGFCVYSQESGDEEKNVYVVHLGKRQHDDHELVSESHHRMLESVLGSMEAARESIVYNYHHGFSGFAARLTKSQARKLSDRPDVFSVARNKKLQLLTTRVYDYLGLPLSSATGVLHEGNMGSGLVIGVIDSGIWPESPAFNDEGFGPIPKHWKGECVAGQEFDPAKHCNKKLIGAKYFFDSFEKKNKEDKVKEEDFMSPRGYSVHGTVVAAIAAGSILPNVSGYGYASGLMRGAAPKACIAVYKVSYKPENFGSGTADMTKAFDEVIKDGVDVVTISLGQSVGPYEPLNGVDEDMEIGSFHAVMKGIPVITAGANSGPEAYTVSNIAPWLFTVAATTLDRALYVNMVLGNNITVMGQTVFTGKVGGETAGLDYIEDLSATIPSSVKGKVILTFLKSVDDAMMSISNLIYAGAVGVICARIGDHQEIGPFHKPNPLIDYEVGSMILRYIRSSSSPTVRIKDEKTLVGRPVATRVAGFSSRGPNSLSPAILKPDIAAPGVMILAADNPINSANYSTYKYNFATGTSMSAPVVAGLVTLLKAVHPDWSPAALKSAIMTTAWKTDPFGQPIFSEGSPRKLADPFDYGAGLVNIEKAKDPGLIYDMNLDDYIHYFCASGYNDTSITVLTGKQTTCSSPLPSILDVNYPAITIPALEKEVTVTRTVTNVGPVDSVYTAVIEPPHGVKIAVEPETLVFSASSKKLAYKVRFTTSRKRNSVYFFGSFTWTDGTRNVTIPLSVRTRVPILP